MSRRPRPARAPRGCPPCSPPGHRDPTRGRTARAAQPPAPPATALRPGPLPYPQHAGPLSRRQPRFAAGVRGELEPRVVAAEHGALAVRVEVQVRRLADLAGDPAGDVPRGE